MFPLVTLLVLRVVRYWNKNWEDNNGSSVMHPKSLCRY